MTFVSLWTYIDQYTKFYIMSEQNEISTAAATQGLGARYEQIKQEGLDLNMTRGKPGPEQLDLSAEMLKIVGPGNFKAASGQDTRNYGGLDGLPEAKALFADFLGASPAEVIIGGNASLTLMHDTVVRALLHGVVGSEKPWGKLEKVKFLCPAPGYDRHFNICQHFGIEMVNIELDENGPNMNQVEALVTEDDTIKGIWCVPKYSNPTGVVYADEVVDRLASMQTKAADFRIFWDNAYAVHHLTDTPPSLKNILAACKKAGNADRVFMFGSTSKISFAGSGVSAMACSEANVAWVLKHAFMQTIGPDKLNQLRHVRFFKDMAGIEAHMEKHKAILKPKFDAVDEILTRELGGKGIAEWTKPQGGYFISLNTQDGCAKRVVELAAQAGVKLTAAGATFPYKNDPRDRNIRIAPSLPSLPEIRKATEVLAVCVLLASGEKN